MRLYAILPSFCSLFYLYWTKRCFFVQYGNVIGRRLEICGDIFIAQSSSCSVG